MDCDPDAVSALRSMAGALCKHSFQEISKDHVDAHQGMAWQCFPDMDINCNLAAIQMILYTLQMSRIGE